jgi:hypothetical protein
VTSAPSSARTDAPSPPGPPGITGSSRRRTPAPSRSVPARLHPPYSLGRHLRASLLLLVFSVLVLAVAYPVGLVQFGQYVDPHAANGSLTHNPNGTVNGSDLLPPGTNSTLGGPIHWGAGSETGSVGASGAREASGPRGETLSPRTPYGIVEQDLASPVLPALPPGGFPTRESSAISGRC